MKFLFPGQRVRVICAHSDKVGAETNVLRVGANGAYQTNRFGLVDEFSNGIEVNIPMRNSPVFKFYVFKPEDVEPIIPFDEGIENEFTKELEGVF